MEDRRFVIVRVALGDLGHGLLEGHDARRVRHAFTLVVGRDRRDVIALARGRPGRQGRGLVRGRLPGGELGRSGRAPDHVIVAHRDAPLRHRARGILSGHRREGLGRLGVGEGVEQRHAALECGLKIRTARRGEVHVAEPLGCSVRVLVLVLREGAHREEREDGSESGEGSRGAHGGSPGSRRRTRHGDG